MTKNLKILLLVLIVILLGAYIIFYYISLPKSPSPPQSGLTPDQRTQALSNLQQLTLKYPPLTTKQRNAALDNLRKLITKQK